jgi:hypothetical protein
MINKVLRMIQFLHFTHFVLVLHNSSRHAVFPTTEFTARCISLNNSTRLYTEWRKSHYTHIVYKTKRLCKVTFASLCISLHHIFTLFPFLMSKNLPLTMFLHIHNCFNTIESNFMWLILYIFNARKYIAFVSSPQPQQNM